MVKKLSCVSHGSLKRFPHTFTSTIQNLRRVLISRTSHWSETIFAASYSKPALAARNQKEWLHHGDDKLNYFSLGHFVIYHFVGGIEIGVKKTVQ